MGRKRRRAIAMMACLLAASGSGHANAAGPETETGIVQEEQDALKNRVLAEITGTSYEKREAMQSVIYRVDVQLTNSSEEEIMEAVVACTFYDDQGEEIFSCKESYNGQDTPLAPGEDVSFQVGGRMEYPEEPASCEVSVLTVYTPEELPPIHIPQEGELLYMALGSEHMENIQTNLPVKIILWIDRMGVRDVAEIEDRDTIEQLVDVFSEIEIGKETMEDVTDNYNGMCFTFGDGTETVISLNLKNLEYRVYHGVRIYELEQFDEFWKLMGKLTKEENS